METRVITVSVRKDIEKKFRETAEAVYGNGKGHLGKAVTEAMEDWNKKKRQIDVNARALEMLEKGFDMGGLKTKNRDEWHER